MADYSPDDVEQAMHKWFEKYVPPRKLNRDSKSDRKDVGEALREIKERRLYRGTHNNFYDYCAERWGLMPARADAYIDFAKNNDRLQFVDTGPNKVPPTREHRFVYFLRGGDLIKIGTTIDVDKRIRNIGTMSPVALELMKFVQGDERFEKSLHLTFSHLCDHGEWFRATPELLTYIENLEPYKENGDGTQ
jgi:hypothetical protein